MGPSVFKHTIIFQDGLIQVSMSQCWVCSQFINQSDSHVTGTKENKRVMESVIFSFCQHLSCNLRQPMILTCETSLGNVRSFEADGEGH